MTYGTAFSSWVLFSNAIGFAAGFALWELSSEPASGTFQALAYDKRERASLLRSSRYARVIGVGTSAALVAMALATLLAAPLMALGSYALTGWVSVAVCAAQFLVARSLPCTPAVISVADVDAAEESSAGLPEPPGAAHVVAGSGVMRAEAAGFLGRYVLALRVGTGEVMRSRVVRGGVLASAVLMGLLAFDEYFGLMLGERGATEVAIPRLLVVVTPARLSAGCSPIGWLGGAMRGSAGSSPAQVSALLRAR